MSLRILFLLYLQQVKFSPNMSSDAKQISPGGFFLRFQNDSYKNPFVYKFEKPIILPRGYTWKVAVTNSNMILQIRNQNVILCSDMVCKSHLNGKEVGVLFSAASLSPDRLNANVTPLYVSVAEERVGVPITEINFQLKQLLNLQLHQYNEQISGWLHFKSENINSQH